MSYVYVQITPSLFNKKFKTLFFVLIADPAEITAHPQNTTQIEGGNVTFTCEATANPAPTFSWIKDGSLANATSTIIFSSDNKQLTIINVSRGDSGHYTCRATNDVKTVQSNSATLDVQCKETY